MTKNFKDLESQSRRAFFRRLLNASSVTGLSALSIAPWITQASQSQSSGVYPDIRSSDRKVRVGVVGIGSRGYRLLLILLRNPAVEIVALCDDYLPNLQRAIVACPRPVNATTAYEKFLETTNLDAVVIATPLVFHASMCVRAMELGIHVFCEKSIARTLQDLQNVRQVYESSTVVLQIGHQRLFDPGYITAINKIRSGEIGKVTQIRAYWHRNNDWRRPVPSHAPELERKLNWRLYSETSGGLMTELACHQIQVANWALGTLPNNVVGTGSLAYWRDGREVFDHVALVYQYPDGEQLIYDSMINNAKYGLEEQILGDKGTIEAESYLLYPENPPPGPGLAQLFTDLRSAVFDEIPLGGSSWIPELGSQHRGISYATGYYDSTVASMDAFIGYASRGERQDRMFAEAYHATAGALLGEIAMETGKRVEWKDEFKIGFPDSLDTQRAQQ